MSTMINILAALSPIFAILCTGIGWLYKQEHEKRYEIEKKLFAKKYEIYAKLIDTLFGIFDPNENARNKTFKNLPSVLAETRKNLFLYGSDDVLRAFINLLTHAFTKQNDSSGLATFHTKLLIAIKKDIGNAKTNVKEMDILKMIVNDHNELEKFISK